jgi:hypothetical protein
MTTADNFELNSYVYMTHLVHSQSRSRKYTQKRTAKWNYMLRGVRMVVVTKQVTCIREVFDSNLGWDTR